MIAIAFIVFSAIDRLAEKSLNCFDFSFIVFLSLFHSSTVKLIFEALIPLFWLDLTKKTNLCRISVSILGFSIENIISLNTNSFVCKLKIVT